MVTIRLLAALFPQAGTTISVRSLALSMKVSPPISLRDDLLSWPRRSALVLSGGSTKGDFEVGACRYLFWHANIRPAIICGTSVGAIAGAKLAEGGNEHSTGSDGLAGLVKLWESLQRNTDMWDWETWFTNAEDLVDAVSNDSPIHLLFSALFGNAVQVLKDDIASAKDARGIANFNALSRLVHSRANLDVEKVRSSGIELRIATVALGDGQLRFIDENGAVFERNGARSTFVPAPPCAAPLLQEIAARAIEFARATAEERKPLLEALNELNVEFDACVATASPIPLTVDLADAVMASCSLPFIIPPVNLGDDWYVDGGIRAVLPIEAAVKAGADMVYAVMAGSATIDAGRSALSSVRLPNYDPGVANFLDIGMRVSEAIMPDENAYRDTNPPNGWGLPVLLIQPTGRDIHDSMTIDPGLIDIRMAQGYMTAEDTVLAFGTDPSNYRELAVTYGVQRHTLDIVDLRFRIWALEFSANGFHENVAKSGLVTDASVSLAGPNAESLALVRDMKRDLKNLVSERLAGKQDPTFPPIVPKGTVPVGAQDWWEKWERHNFPIPTTIALWDADHPAP